MKTTVIVVLACVLSACVGATVSSKTERSITLYATIDSPSQQLAADQAETYCRERGLHARRSGDVPISGSTTRVTFDCVP